MKKTSFKGQSAVDSLLFPSARLKEQAEKEQHQTEQRTPATNRETVVVFKGELPEGIDYRTLETKSKHIHLMLKPSLFDDVSQFAKVVGVSRNEAFSLLIEKGLKEWK